MPEKLTQMHSLFFRMSLAPLEFCILIYSNSTMGFKLCPFLGGSVKRETGCWTQGCFLCVCLPVNIWLLMLFWASLDLIFSVQSKTDLQEGACSPGCRFRWAAEAVSSFLWFLSIRERDRALFPFLSMHPLKDYHPEYFCAGAPGIEMRPSVLSFILALAFRIGIDI